MLVYHYSEDRAITRFVPRAGRLGEPLVWAIDEWHAPLYWLPRACPRVTFWPHGPTTREDYARWWSSVAGRMVVAIEAAWLARVRSCRLYCYSFDDPSFVSLDDNGMWVSRAEVRPVAVEAVGDLLARHAEGGVELRLCQSLLPLGKAIIRSTMDFSLIRMRNAQGWEQG